MDKKKEINYHNENTKNRVSSLNRPEVRDKMTPYIRLIEAIIQSGRATNDTAFLEGDWYKFLWENYVALWQDYSKKSGKATLRILDSSCRR